MVFNDILKTLDIEINNTKAESVIEKVRVESYYRGKVDGIEGIKEQLINQAQKEFEDEQEKIKETPAPQTTPEEETKTPTSKKK